MKDTELMNIWKSYEDKLDQVLTLNKEIIYEMTKEKMNKNILRLRWPKTATILIGIPFTLLCYFITFVGVKAQAVFVTFGFGIISIVMSAMLISYMYHLYLINKISCTEKVMDVQKALAELKIASFHSTRIAIIQIPFWSISWVSYNALVQSPYLYGGINLIVFLAMSYFTYWLYQNLTIRNVEDSKVSQFLFSGPEWEPILKASSILEQLDGYEANSNR